MEVVFESRDRERPELREMAMLRAHFVLRRLAWLVPTARVRLADADGPQGSSDKCCRVELQTHRGNVIAHSRARDWRGALDTALGRAARLLLRAVRRAHQPRSRRRAALVSLR